MGDRGQAIQFFNAGVQAINQADNPERLTLSYQLFASAVHMDPTWWEANYRAGNINSDLNNLPAAIASWRRALQCETEPSERADVMSNLSWRLHCVGEYEEAYDYAEQAIDINPMLAYAHVNRALILGIWDRKEEALDSAKRAYAIKPDDPVVEMCVAFSYLFDHQWDKGLKHFEARFPYKMKNYLKYPYPKWLGEKDKTIFIVADQGLGDTLCFARFLPQAAARSKHIYAYVQGELMRTFAYAFAHLNNVSFMPTNTPFPPADHWTTFMSLPFALQCTNDEIRHIPNYTMVEGRDFPNDWKVTDKKFHIGCAWAGSARNEINPHRSCPVTMLAELYRVPGVQLYSLQVGDQANDLHNAGMAPIMRDIVPYIRDVSNTVALMHDLDLIISCESACAHIASLAGVECWVPYSYRGRDWRIGHTGEDRLWTPRHRIFRQGPDARWEPVFKTIVGELRDHVYGAKQMAA